MIFSSTVFLFRFLPVVIVVYYLCRPELRNIVLLFASLFFYAWGEPDHVILILFSIIANYFLCIWMEKCEKGKILFLVFSILLNLSLLFYYKYFNFAAAIAERFFNCNIAAAEIALPIGISFYTFQIMSYVIDVYWGNVNVQKSIVNLSLYITLFPQLIAGPIVRYVDIETQLGCRKLSIDKIYDGAVLFMQGFSKKILLADQISPLVDAAFQDRYPSIYLKWMGAAGYTLQIYFDFSGYSDMAVGLGKLFGFDFTGNFKYPYLSKSVQEFWRRWHISLSQWFRDYVYIPLGGSRCGMMRACLNLLAVFFLTGLWHGASFNFIVWGLYYAVLLIAERLGWGCILERIPRFLRHLYVLFVVMIGWVIFRADHLGMAVEYIADMFTIQGDDWNRFYYCMNRKYWFCLAAGCILSVPHLKVRAVFEKYQAGRVIHNMLVVIIFILAICCMTGSGVSPFLYFRF